MKNNLNFKKMTLLMTAILLGASFAQADLLFLLSESEKKSAVESGIVEEKLFSYPNPNVLVLSKDTSADIKLVQDDGLIEVSKKCYVGSSSDAAQIVEKLILNSNQRAAVATEIKSLKVEKDGQIAALYEVLDQEDVVDSKVFEIGPCEKTKSEDPPMDTVVGRFAMCPETVVRLPDLIYFGIEEAAQLQASDADKLSRLQGLFASLNADGSEASYCNVMTKVAGKTKPQHLERCAEAIVTDELVNLDLLEALNYKRSKDEVLCAFSATINFMTFGF